MRFPQWCYVSFLPLDVARAPVLNRCACVCVCVAEVKPELFPDNRSSGTLMVSNALVLSLETRLKQTNPIVADLEQHRY